MLLIQSTVVRLYKLSSRATLGQMQTLEARSSLPLRMLDRLFLLRQGIIPILKTIQPYLVNAASNYIRSQHRRRRRHRQHQQLQLQLRLPWRETEKKIFPIALPKSKKRKTNQL